MALPNNTICCANAGLKMDALHCTAGDVTGPCRQSAGVIRSRDHFYCLFFFFFFFFFGAGALGQWLAPLPFTPESGVRFPVSAV